MSLESWGALFITCVALSLSPGPSSTYALATSIRQGAIAGFKAVLGSTLGFSTLILIALVGLTAFVATLPWLVSFMKGIGALYLLWLAFTLWRSANANEPHTEMAQQKSLSRHHAVVRGFLIALSNPKIVLFWLAFMPSIVAVDALTTVDMAVVIATFALVEAGVELALVWFGAAAQHFLAKHVRLIDRFSAVIFVLFAIMIVLSE